VYLTKLLAAHYTALMIQELVNNKLRTWLRPKFSYYHPSIPEDTQENTTIHFKPYVASTVPKVDIQIYTPFSHTALWG
jgi:hypothetical protein